MVDGTSITEIFKKWLDKSLCGVSWVLDDLTLAQRDGLVRSPFWEAFCRREICIQQVKYWM